MDHVFSLVTVWEGVSRVLEDFYAASTQHDIPDWFGTPIIFTKPFKFSTATYSLWQSNIGLAGVRRNPQISLTRCTVWTSKCRCSIHYFTDLIIDFISAGFRNRRGTFRLPNRRWWHWKSLSLECRISNVHFPERVDVVGNPTNEADGSRSFDFGKRRIVAKKHEMEN